MASWVFRVEAQTPFRLEDRRMLVWVRETQPPHTEHPLRPVIFLLFINCETGMFAHVGPTYQVSEPGQAAMALEARVTQLPMNDLEQSLFAAGKVSYYYEGKGPGPALEAGLVAKAFCP